MDDIKKVLFIREYEGNRSSMLEVIADCTHLVPLRWEVDSIDEISDEIGMLTLFNDEVGIKVKPGDHILIGEIDDGIVVRVIDNRSVAKKIERRMIKEYVLDEINDDDTDERFIDALVDRIQGQQDNDALKPDHEPGSDECYKCKDIGLCLLMLISLGKYDEASDILDVLKSKED